MRERSGRTLTLIYMVALILVALMSAGSHLTLNSVLREHEGAASVLNISGRQRMLSQRIASMAAQHALGLPTARDDLLAAVMRLEASHTSLIVGDAALKVPAATDPALQAIYFGGPAPLNAAIGDFIARARRIGLIEAGDPALRDEIVPLLELARSPLLDGLDAVVMVHQRASEQQLGLLQGMQTASLVIVLLTLLGEALGIFRPMVTRIASYTHDLMRLATTDPLTGALNRRSFGDRAMAELSRAQRYGRPTTLLMIDADRFKAINDRFGHGGGDAVLQALSNALTGCLRPSDLLGRLGGEEFAVLLAETGLAGGQIAAERMRRVVEAMQVEDDGGPIRFTISIGIAACEPGPRGLKRAMDEADAALYEAKAGGRNRVALSTGAMPMDGAVAV